VSDDIIAKVAKDLAQNGLDGRVDKKRSKRVAELEEEIYKLIAGKNAGEALEAMGGVLFKLSRAAARDLNMEPKEAISDTLMIFTDSVLARHVGELAFEAAEAAKGTGAKLK
jgi:hypothetical protein